MKKMKMKYVFAAILSALFLLSTLSSSVLALEAPTEVKDNATVETLDLPFQSQLSESQTSSSTSPSDVEETSIEGLVVSNSEAGTDSEVLESKVSDPIEKQFEKQLVSETPVTAYLVRFFDMNNKEIKQVSVQKGSTIDFPEAPEMAGFEFKHWFLVNDKFEGDSDVKFDEKQTVQAALRLKTFYHVETPALETPISESRSTPEMTTSTNSNDVIITPNTSADSENSASTEPSLTNATAAETNPETEIVEIQPTMVNLAANVTLSGKSIEDQQFFFELKDEQGQVLQTVSNEADGKIVFAPIVLDRAESDQIQSFFINQQKGADKNIVYDETILPVQVRFSVDTDAAMTAVIEYPKTAQFLNIYQAPTPIAPTPMIKLYTNVTPGQKLAFGDEIEFSAELSDCGDAPLIQWQFSPDNVHWQNIAGANDSTLTILLTPQNCFGYWRAGVTITN